MLQAAALHALQKFPRLEATCTAPTSHLGNDHVSSLHILSEYQGLNWRLLLRGDGGGSERWRPRQPAPRRQVRRKLTEGTVQHCRPPGPPACPAGRCASPQTGTTPGALSAPAGPASFTGSLLVRCSTDWDCDIKELSYPSPPCSKVQNTSLICIVCL